VNIYGMPRYIYPIKMEEFIVTFDFVIAEPSSDTSGPTDIEIVIREA
jgi:hypothetical protein